MDDLLADFLTETNEGLAELDIALIRLERSPGDGETLSQIFRLVHTIKGTCGFLGLPGLERVAHAAETVLGRVRDRVLPVTPDLVSTVLSAIDRIKAIVATLAATEAEPGGDDSPLIAALEAAAEGRAAAAPIAEAEPAAAAAQTIRVGVEVLEDLMTLVGELVLTRNQLLQIARGQTDSAFAAPLQRLSHITSDLQEGVMKTRMQPIGHAWNKLPRLVRDLGRDLGKKIELVMRGAGTELDRQVLELIRAPLTHMVRNSGDHGLETPAERRAAGKPEEGRITLDAFHEGGHVVIEIADDGAGLPTDRIRRKAVAQGLATEAELAAMSDAQIHRFIFRPGFSTAAAVTAVSGRGVGMDVVKTNIERIGGVVDVRSVPGQGTIFTIRIPLTLAIVAALIVEAGGQRFAIPQIGVVELVRADRPHGGTPCIEHIGGTPHIERIDDTPVLRLRDQLLPLADLGSLLDLRPCLEDRPHIVVAQAGAGSFGLIVDRIFDTEEIVVKPVAPVLRNIALFSGNTILGDGSVVMILDPAGIARAIGIAAGGRPIEAPATPNPETDDPRTALLLVRAGGPEPKAVPLGLVARLEEIPRDAIETTSGVPMTQYRGRLMPLMALSGSLDLARPRQAVLVFGDVDPGRDRCMGLVVDDIVDVVEDRLQIELAGEQPGLLGTAVVAGHATDIIDAGYWLTRAFPDWFHVGDTGSAARPAHVLVVEDSDFFRQLLVPGLGAAGYQVTAVAGATEALRLRDAGVMVDAIVSDIEMPDLDGLAFVRRVRADGAWAALPVIALTGRGGAAQIETGRDAGFTDYVQKFERGTLLESLRQCLAVRVGLRLAA